MAEGASYRSSVNDEELAILDPCAGEGDAALALLSWIVSSDDVDQIHVYGCELEEGRAKRLKENARHAAWRFERGCVHGDAHRVFFDKREKDGIGLLYLNPPYDTNKVYGRLEHRFLDRFASTLMLGGILVFVVPYHALRASAALLATDFEDVRAFRFPENDFEAYKQIVLVAKKKDAELEPDADTLSRVQAWASFVDSMPELPEIGSDPLFDVPVSKAGNGGLEEWCVRPIDFVGLFAKIRPWSQTMRGGRIQNVPGIVPEGAITDLLLRTYPLATPPRPAHIAAGIASGVFNGARIEAKTSNLPDLLVKGVFDREYKTVEEKRNKDGDVTALVQVQQPKLVTTILNLATHTYHTLPTGTSATGSKDVASMNVADLLVHYGDALMRVMMTQCPVTYDPRRDADSVTLAETARKPFVAQAHAVRAIVTLLGGQHAKPSARRGKTAILLGEVGVGKSFVALTTAATIGTKRMLVMCPPHLLDGWRDETKFALNGSAEVRVLKDVDDVRALSHDRSPKTIVAILSRETAKLSHGWESVGAVCPRCGSRTPSGDHAKKRSRCEAKQIRPKNGFARFAVDLAQKLLPYAPLLVSSVLRGRLAQARADRPPVDTRGFGPGFGLDVESAYWDNVLAELVTAHAGTYGDQATRVGKAIVFSLLASGDRDRALETAKALLGTKYLSTYSETAQLARQLLLFVPPGHPSQTNTIAWIRSQSGITWAEYDDDRIKRSMDEAVVLRDIPISWNYAPLDENGRRAPGPFTLNGMRSGSLAAAMAAFKAILPLAVFKTSPSCGEFLFSATKTPARTPLSRHIVKHYPDLFDFFVLDEAHEAATDGSAQERAAHRLMALRMPTVIMTGTIMNGYAESLFANMWASSPKFRSEFTRDEKQRYLDRYGYRKRLVEDRNEKSEVVAFGSMSDRVETSERIIGNAPGILPLFLLRHLLPLAVTLHKVDLAIDLPSCRQVRHNVMPSAAQHKEYVALQNALVQRIKADMFDQDLSGKLFGQLAEFPSYLDRATCDVGNGEDGYFTIAYPESCGGVMIARGGHMPEKTILPKEAWMLDLVEKELAEGRNVMVFPWHVTLLPRIQRLLETRLGEPCPILYADKVPTAKRQAWIAKEIVKPNRRVLITNPVAIQTGLNNLVHFSSEIWLENPAVNPLTFRQGIGRIDRIGQKRETLVHIPVYEGTLQEQLYDLLMRKVAVSVSTDGLDPESALQAAGLGEDEYMTGLSIGKEIWNLLGGVDGVPKKAKEVSRCACGDDHSVMLHGKCINCGLGLAKSG
jgi:hypothetical protein